MQQQTVKRGSRFVTGLGWFALVVGGFSFFARAYGAVFAIAEPETTRATLVGVTHPIDIFVRDHLVFFALLYVVATLLLCITGVGLVRRRRWALWTGAVFLVMGCARQCSGLIRALSGSAEMPGGPGIGIALIGVSAISLLWQAWLLWFFRRDSVRAEFEA